MSVIDQDHLARQTAGDVDLQRELLVLFLAQIEHLSGRLGKNAATPDEIDPELPFLVHQLRGGAAAVGAVSLSGSLGRIEADLLLGTLSRSALTGLATEMIETKTAVEDLIAGSAGASLAKGGESR